jgi:hypothetical protein
VVFAGTPTPGASISGLRIWNNVIWGNTNAALLASISSPQTMTIAQFDNNIIGNNGGIDLDLPGACTLLQADYNLYWHPAGCSWFYNITNRAVASFAAWQKLGFDLHGINAAPLFINSASANPFFLNFGLLPGSPGQGMGIPSGFFTTDMYQQLRPTANWELGAVQSQLLAPPFNLHIVSQ